MSEGLKLKIRKDLSRWSRKLLLCVGLEDIAKSLVGEEKFQNLYPWKDLEQEKIPVDFDPSAEPDIPADNTHSSAASADLSHVDDPSETPEEEEEVGVEEEKTEPSLENFLHLLPYWCFINRAFGGVPGGGNTPEDIVVGRGEGEDLTSAANDALDVNQRLNSFLLLETLRQQYAQVVPTGLQNSFHVQNSPFLSPDIYEANKIPKFHHSYLNTDVKYHGLNEALHTGLRGLSSTDQEEEDRDDEPNEPLDLTQKNKGAEKFSENRKYGSREVNTTTIETKPNKVSPRPAQPRSGKGYTSTELELALRDIQSGKLGTRRAAVIYGIPRSTLRNKVYKLGKDRNRPYFRPKNTATNFTEDQKDSTSSSLLNIDTRITDQISTGARIVGGGGGETGIEFQNTNIGLPHTSLSSSSSLSISNSHSQGVHASCSGAGGGDSEEDDELGRIRSEEEISHEKKMLKEWLRTKLSRQAFEQHLNSPILNERFNSSSDVNQNSAIMEPQSDNSSDNSDEISRQDLRKEVILKIPSLINNKSSLSRMISRKKLKRRSPREEEDEEATTRTDNLPSYPIPLLNMLGLETASSTTNRLTGGEGNNGMSSRNWKNPRLSNNNNNNENESMDDIDFESKSLLSGNKQDKYNSSWGDYDKELQSSSSTSNSNNNNNNSADGKKSRPKRGKYRNYDRDALLKAVRAVQDGQMSVHRAGSFYGVPHSTLEYKVKERHLLRRPKRKETDSPKLSKSSPETSMSGSDPQRNSGTPGAETTNSLPLTPDLRESLSRYMNISNTSSSFKNSDEAHGENQSRLDQLSNHSSSLGIGRGISPFLNLNLFNLDDLLIRQNLGTVGNSNSLLDLTKK